MRCLVVLEFDIPGPEQAADVLIAIDPPHLPFFTGNARVVPDPYATELTDWLDA